MILHLRNTKYIFLNNFLLFITSSSHLLFYKSFDAYSLKLRRKFSWKNQSEKHKRVKAVNMHSQFFCPIVYCAALLKVGKFQNEFMKSSFLPKCEPNIVRISALYSATLPDQKSLKFLFIFWEKRWFKKIILKFTDL